MTIDIVGSPTLHRGTALKELSVARLTVDRQVGTVNLPAGTQGTIVFVYQDGVAYEVEFFEPIATVLTVTAAELAQ